MLVTYLYNIYIYNVTFLRYEHVYEHVYECVNAHLCTNMFTKRGNDVGFAPSSLGSYVLVNEYVNMFANLFVDMLTNMFAKDTGTRRSEGCIEREIYIYVLNDAKG